MFMFHQPNRATASRVSKGLWFEPLEGRLLFSSYIVTTLGDSVGSVTPNGSGKFNATTLRAAITAANAHSGADTINFASGLTGKINLGTALPQITSTLTLSGPGPSSLTVQRSSAATGNFSIFHIVSGKTAVIRGLKIANGTGDTGGVNGDPSGGGVFNAGTLSLTNCTVSGNSTNWGGGIYNVGSFTSTDCTFSDNAAKFVNVGGSGGGVFNSGTMSLVKTAFTGNTAFFFGGGVVNHGPATLTNCTFSSNSSTDNQGGGGIDNGGTMTVVLSTFSGNSAGIGGGILNQQVSHLTVSGCTFAANSMVGSGGGIYSDGIVTVTNSTLSANSALFGGGIYNSEFGTLTLTNATLSGNLASISGGGVYSKSGGTVTLHNTIVVGNNKGGATDEIFGAVKSVSSFNIIGTSGKGGLTNGVNGNKTGVSLSALKLGPLAFNGGKTRTMALLAGSPAIDAGSNARASAAGLFADQRGLPRVANGTVDIGAFEVQTSGSIAGTFFNDKNHDGARQSATEPALSDWQVYLDQNKNGIYDAGEQTTFTSSTGAYQFTGLVAGTYRVREVRQDGWTRTKPAGVYPLGYYDVSVYEGAVSGKDFGNYLT